MKADVAVKRRTVPSSPYHPYEEALPIQDKDFPQNQAGHDLGHEDQPFLPALLISTLSSNREEDDACSLMSDIPALLPALALASALQLHLQILCYPEVSEPG